MARIDPVDATNAPGVTVTSEIDGTPAAAFIPVPVAEIEPDTDAVQAELAAAERACDRLRHALAGTSTAERRRVVARQLRDVGLTDGERHRYGAAVDRAVTALTEGTFTPATVRALHRLRVADDDAAPGRFRRRQGYVADPDAYRLVVTPPHAVDPEMRALCEYVVGDSGRHPLVDAALIHYQFLTVHPFRDGSGRTVRALTDALLRDATPVDGPGLSLVPYILRHKQAYHDALLTANETGDFTPFLRLFLRGVREQADRSRRAVGGGDSPLAALRATLAGLF